MGGDALHRRPYNLSGCMSQSFVAVQGHYTRIHSNSSNRGGGDKSPRKRRLRKLLQKIVDESRSIYEPPKPTTFQYDAVSYSQNFDEGCHGDDEYARRHIHVVLQEFRRSQPAVCKK